MWTRRQMRTWLLPALLVVAWLVIGGVAGPYAGQLGSVATNDDAAFLPTSAEATQVAQLQGKFRDQDLIPAVVVFERTEGITPQDTAAVDELTKSLADLSGVAGKVAGPIPSEDGKALELIVPLDSGLGDALPTLVQDIDQRAHAAAPAGLEAYVTGPAGFTADLVDAFGGIDGILLLVALLVVLVILVVVYRSPLLPFVVLLTALFALSLASGVVYVLADHDVITLNGQSQGILSILVVGAATDYALLLTSRFREELREEESRMAAMRVALRQSFAPITASGVTVIIALLCLLLSDLNSTSSLGPVAALGIASSLLAALTFLPAALVLLGRSAFWPKRPRYGSAHPERSGIWGRVAGAVDRRPRRIWLAATGVLIVLAAFATTFQASGVPQTALFLDPVDSVTGQAVAARHFPGGTGSPVVIIGPADQTQAMVQAATDVEGIDSVTALGEGQQPVSPGGEPKVVDGLVEVQGILQASPDSSQALETVQRLRDAEHAAVPSARVGGATAITLDTQNTAESDRRLIIPVVLGVILVLLGLLLRAVVASILLLASVVLSFAATLGVSALVFDHVLDFPGADPSVPLYGFVFLVALGIDYNIFLMTRVREESQQHGTREGVSRGLAVTGGVITSAGVVLAATFSALGVIPILFLAQIAFIVAFGVLLDTLVVRSLLVPALVHDIGPAVWWPSALARRAPADQR